MKGVNLIQFISLCRTHTTHGKHIRLTDRLQRNLWLMSGQVSHAARGVTVRLTGDIGKTINRTVIAVFLSLKTITVTVYIKTVENRTAVNRIKRFGYG